MGNHLGTGRVSAVGQGDSIGAKVETRRVSAVGQGESTRTGRPTLACLANLLPPPLLSDEESGGSAM
jgi:hypothetical protein